MRYTGPPREPISRQHCCTLFLPSALLHLFLPSTLLYLFLPSRLETKGSDLSRQNQDKAEMIFGFYQYLILIGIKHSQITVLTITIPTQEV